MIVCYNTRIKTKLKGSGKKRKRKLNKKGYFSLTNKNYKDCMAEVIQNCKTKITKR